MPAFVTFGRILFAVLFIYSGAAKLFVGIQGHIGLYRHQGHGDDSRDVSRPM